MTCAVSDEGNMVQNGYCPDYYCDRHLIVSAFSQKSLHAF